MDTNAILDSIRLLEPYVSSPNLQGLGLLLIVNNIGDARNTVRKPLWLKDGKTMIRTGLEDSSRYEVWSFSCTSKKNHQERTQERKSGWVEDVKRELSKLHNLVEQRKDWVYYWQLYKTWLKRRSPNIETFWKRNPAWNVNQAFSNHVVEKKNEHGMRKELWLLSETGVVDPSKLGVKGASALAKFMAKSVEGGEVVEIRSVSSTSVMVNACYDIMRSKQGISPYACLGFGSSFVSVSNSKLVARPACKFKMGLGMQIAPNVTAFASGYYHQVLGGIKNLDLPVTRLIDDFSPDGRTKDVAVSSFGVSYAGCELGVRFMF